MQERISFDGYDAVQPDSFEPEWETTYEADSGRPMSGKAVVKPLFTAESYSVVFSDLTKAQASKILASIVPRKTKTTYQLHYYSWFYGKWMTDTFYTGKGSLSVKTLKKDKERCSISFNVIGVKPL